MRIKEAQNLVDEHLTKIGYKEIEKTPCQAFLHLVEEVGEVARALLHHETGRSKMYNKTIPKDLSEEVADIFWQTLKLAIYLDTDLESAFAAKLEKNRNKGKTV